MNLTSASSPDEVAAFLLATAPEAWASEVAEHARTNGVDGAALLAAVNTSDSAIGAVLSQAKFGRQRKLKMLIDAASSSAAAAPCSSSAAAPCSSSAAAADGAPSLANLASADGELDCAACEQQLQDECYALGLVKWCGNTLDASLGKKNSLWASDEVRQARLDELASHRKTCELPGVSIVVVGNTGAGKSTLINALLDETQVRSARVPILYLYIYLFLCR